MSSLVYNYSIPSKKCVFVGSCTKSSLIYNYAKSDDDLFRMGDLKIESELEGKEFILEFLETSHDPQYDRLRPLSYHGTHVAVVCFSADNYQSFIDVKDKWIPELKEYCPNVPKILVALEIEKRQEEAFGTKISNELALKTCSDCNFNAYVECSVLNQVGMTELLNVIKECAMFPERFVKKKKSNETGIFGKLKNVFQTKPKQESTSSVAKLEKNRSVKSETPLVAKDVSKIQAVSRNFNQLPFEEWTTEEVGKWLETKGCSQTIIDILKSQEFNGPALLYCEKQDLTSLSIPLGNAISIMKWIEPFKRSSTQSGSSENVEKQSTEISSVTPEIASLKPEVSGSTASDFPTNSFNLEFQISEISSSANQSQENEFEKRYTILEKLGAGGFGKVFKVMTKKSNQIRAVKVVSPNQDFTINQALSEALKQAQLYRNDNHIVHVYEVFIAEENFAQIVCIEMDCMEGSLRSIFKGRKMSERMIWSILRQIGAALKFLSESGKIVHRDIKPDNILVKRVDFELDEIEVYLSDFGLAKSTTNSHQTSHISGTFFFLAPEILDYANSAAGETNQSPYSIASDIFALGVSMYQIMCNDTTSNVATLCKYGTSLIKQNIPLDVYSEKLVSLVLDMLKRDPKERPLINDILYA